MDSNYLSKIERLLFIQQLQILKKLTGGHTPGYDLQIKALEAGYVDHYTDLFATLDEEFPISESRFVLDTLTLHDRLWQTYQALPNKGDLQPEDLKFRGFEEQTEAPYLRYARYLCFELERFRTSIPRHTDLKSPRPMISNYKTMLATAQRIFPITPVLTATHLREILHSPYTTER